MLIKVTLIAVILLYAITLAENLLYRVTFSKSSFSPNSEGYAGLKNVFDAESRIVVAYFILLITSIHLVAFCSVNLNGFLFRCSMLSFILLMTDIFLLVKGNIAINKKMKMWTPLLYPENWENIRRKATIIHTIRHLLNVLAFVTLIAGVAFGM